MKQTEFKAMVKSQRRITLPAIFQPGDVVIVEVREVPIVREGTKRIVPVIPYAR
jgi:bifunctional DNA-binding transcriptional regulator/antitoxin component of YhaV-PrlF toxin-antitoxin module